MKKLFEKFKSLFKSKEEAPETKQEGRIRTKVKAVGKKVKGLKPKKKKK